MRGVSVRLRDVGEVGAGLLEVHSSSMMSGYLSPGGIVPGVDADGRFTTGDVARIAPGGHLELLARQGDVINVTGHKVLPSEVEAVIAGMAQVAEVNV